LLLPLLRRLPLTWFYPTGAKQDRPGNSRAPVYRRVQVIAGDFHFLWRYLPADLAGKGVIASSLWPEECALLRTRGAAWVATPLPAVEGRSWAANIWEAALTAAVGRTRLEGWGEEVLWSRLQEAGLRPRMEVFHGKTGR
ncbi:MAG: hypothetical protein H5U01_01430, partial [Clostridia bacterium]|nr:hypothetical protein [Clostridia bacterium]